MGTFRVTTQIIANRTLNNLSYQQRKLLSLQNQLSTMQRVNRPSDDPMATRRAMGAQSVVAQNEQYITNISTIGPYLSETETTIKTVEQYRQRAMELALQGSSGTNGQVQREQIAIEINQVLEDVASQANHITNGRYIFGGTDTKTKAFTVARNAAGEITGVTFAGNNRKFQVEVQTGARVNINETGDDVFMDTGGTSVNLFQTLIDIRDSLRSGDMTALETSTKDLTSGQDQLMVAVTRLGSTQNRIDRIDENLQDINTQEKGVVSDNIDVDVADLIVKINVANNAYQASLNAAARVIQPSLLDYIG